MPYNGKLFALRLVTWCYNYLLRITISWNDISVCKQHDSHYIEIMTWNHIIVRQIICIR